jgi:hypothetical protein
MQFCASLRWHTATQRQCSCQHRIPSQLYNTPAAAQLEASGL